jgi:hypothetical protein
MKALLTRRQRLGLTWAELAAESGVPPSTLQWWHRRLQAERKPRRRSRFVAVKIAQPQAASADLVEIVLAGGRRVRVSPEFDAEHLRRVVAALEGC